MKKNIIIAVVVVLIILAISVLFANIKKARLAHLSEQPEMATVETATVVVPTAPTTITQTSETASGIKTEDIEKTQIAASTAALPADRNRLIQTALKNANLYTGEIDGKIGPLTKKAVEEFQRLKGLKVDGKVGPQTWAALKDYLPEETQQQQ